MPVVTRGALQEDAANHHAKMVGQIRGKIRLELARAPKLKKSIEGFLNERLFGIEREEVKRAARSSRTRISFSLETEKLAKELAGAYRRGGKQVEESFLLHAIEMLLSDAGHPIEDGEFRFEAAVGGSPPSAPREVSAEVVPPPVPSRTPQIAGAIGIPALPSPPIPTQIEVQDPPGERPEGLPVTQIGGLVVQGNVPTGASFGAVDGTVVPEPVPEGTEPPNGIAHD